METELTLGVLLGEGKRVGKGEREKREREHTEQPHMGERCRELERKRCKEAESYGKRRVREKKRKSRRKWGSSSF